MTILELKNLLEAEIQIKMDELKILGEQYHTTINQMTEIALLLEPVQELIGKQYPCVSDMLTELLDSKRKSDAFTEELKNEFQKTRDEYKKSGKKHGK